MCIVFSRSRTLSNFEVFLKHQRSETYYYTYPDLLAVDTGWQGPQFPGYGPVVKFACIDLNEVPSLVVPSEKSGIVTHGSHTVMIPSMTYLCLMQGDLASQKTQ